MNKYFQKLENHLEEHGERIMNCQREHGKVFIGMLAYVGQDGPKKRFLDIGAGGLELISLDLSGTTGEEAREIYQTAKESLTGLGASLTENFIEYRVAINELDDL